MTPHDSDNISVVLKYFHDGCNSGDLDVLLSTLDPDVVHYFLPARFPTSAATRSSAGFIFSRVWR